MSVDSEKIFTRKEIETITGLNRSEIRTTTPYISSIHEDNSLGRGVNNYSLRDATLLMWNRILTDQFKFSKHEANNFLASSDDFFPKFFALGELLLNPDISLQSLISACPLLSEDEKELISVPGSTLKANFKRQNQITDPIFMKLGKAILLGRYLVENGRKVEV